MRDDRLGRLEQQWELTFTPEILTVLHTSRPQTEVDVHHAVGHGLSTPVELGHGVSVQVGRTQPGNNDLSDLTGARWSLTTRAPSQLDPGMLAAQLQRSLGERSLREIFGDVPVEPFKTFQNLWATHPQLAYRLGGLLLGVVYRRGGT